MEDIIRKRIEKEKGRDIKIILKDNYIFSGKLTNYDDEYLEILDYKTNSYKLLLISEIKQLEVINEKL